MLKKLLLIGASIWLGKMGIDTIMAAQNTPPSRPRRSHSKYRTDEPDTPLNPVLNPEIAAQLHDVTVKESSANTAA